MNWDGVIFNRQNLIDTFEEERKKTYPPNFEFEGGEVSPSKNTYTLKHPLRHNKELIIFFLNPSPALKAITT